MSEKHTLFTLGETSKGWMVLAIIANLLITTATVVFIDRTGVIVRLVEDFIKSNPETRTFPTEVFQQALIIMFCAIVIRLIFSWSATKAVYEIGAKVKLDTRKKIYSKILDLELAYRDVKKTGSLSTTTVEGVEQLENIYGLVTPQAFLSILVPAGLYFYLKPINGTIALTLLLMVFLIPISLVFVRAWISRVAKSHWGVYENLNAYYLDSLQGITTLKTFGLLEKRTKLIGEKSEAFRIRTMNLLYSNLVSTLSMDIIAMVGTATGIALAIHYLQTGAITVASATVVVLIAYEFFRPLRMLGAYTHIAMQAMAAIRSIFELLNQDPKKDELSRKTAAETVNLNGNYDIVFRNVNFSYKDDRNPVLKGLNLELKTGQITALVGSSGCGKSTIANLITRFYEPSGGEITIGKQSLYKINPLELRKNIAVVAQRTYLFHGSIKENLLIAKPDATDAELYETCRKAGIIDFVNSLPEKLDASLVEQARNLSSGQIQRIGIARALLKDAPILILDEPTSNVDVENEEKIQATLHEIAKTKTTLVIAHRLRTVREADKIVVIDKGNVVETGTHDELIKRKAAYATLVNSQQRLETPSMN